MTVYWFHGGGQAPGPYDMKIAVAEGTPQACALFGEAFPSPCVHQLHAPELLDMVEGLIPGDVVAMRVDRLPSFYDQFRCGTGMLDLAAMRRDDHCDVS